MQWDDEEREGGRARKEDREEGGGKEIGARGGRGEEIRGMNRNRVWSHFYFN